MGYPLFYNLILYDHCLVHCGTKFLGTVIGYTKDEIKNITFNYNESLNKISDKYGIKTFLSVTKYMGLSFSEWMNMSIPVREIMINEIDEMIASENRKVNEQKQQQELEMKQMQFRNRNKGASAADSISIFKK